MTAFLTAKEAAGLGLTTEKPAKFRNRKVTHDGRTFHSKAEGDRYLQLRNDLARGEISQLSCQPTFVIFKAYRLGKKHIAAIRYIADFMYLRKSDGRWVVEDVKSKATKNIQAYRDKVKMFQWCNMQGWYPHEYEFKEVLM